LYFQDESRFGFITKEGRMITAKGVKPICISYQVYSSTWLFGIFSPITGNHLLMEFPNCNADNFKIFLNEISFENPKTLIIIVLDNRAFHKNKKINAGVLPPLLLQTFYEPCCEDALRANK